MISCEIFQKRLTKYDPCLCELQIDLQVSLQTDFYNGNVRAWLVSELGQLHGAVPHTCTHKHTDIHSMWNLKKINRRLQKHFKCFLQCFF